MKRIICALILMAILAGCETVPNSFALFTYGKVNSPTEQAREKEKKQTVENEKQDITIRNLEPGNIEK